MRPPRATPYEAIPPQPHRDVISALTLPKLGIAAGLIVLAAGLGVVLAEQAPDMARTSTLTMSAGGGAHVGISAGHS